MAARLPRRSGTAASRRSRSSTGHPIDLAHSQLVRAWPERANCASSSVNLQEGAFSQQLRRPAQMQPSCCADQLTSRTQIRLPVHPPERLHLCPRLCCLEPSPLRCRRSRQLEATMSRSCAIRRWSMAATNPHRGHTVRRWTEPLRLRPTEPTASAVACIERPGQRLGPDWWLG